MWYSASTKFEASINTFLPTSFAGVHYNALMFLDTTHSNTWSPRPHMHRIESVRTIRFCPQKKIQTAVVSQPPQEIAS